MVINQNQLRSIVIDLLDDEHGLSERQYQAVERIAKLYDATVTDDIMDAVEVAEGRTFLPESHGLQ